MSKPHPWRNVAFLLLLCLTTAVHAFGDYCPTPISWKTCMQRHGTDAHGVSTFAAFETAWSRMGWVKSLAFDSAAEYFARCDANNDTVVDGFEFVDTDCIGWCPKQFALHEALCG